MLARSVCGKYVKDVARANFATIGSGLSLADELPVRPGAPYEPKPTVTETQTTKNGFKVVARKKATGIVNFKVAVLGGSSAETHAQKGSAHFLAANAYNGNGEFSGIRTVNFFEENGAKFSASADREKVVYDVAVLADRAHDVLDVLFANIAGAPARHVYDESKPDVKNLYNTFRHTPALSLNDLVHEAAFGDNTGYGASLYAPSLKKLSVDEVLNFRNKNFVRQNVVVAADGIDAYELVQLVETAEENLTIPSGTANVVVVPKYVGGELKVRTFNADGVSHAALAFPRPSGEAGKAYDVLKSLLCTRLTKKGVNASVFQNKYANGGVLGVTSSGCGADIEKTFRSVVDELKAIAGNASEAESRKNAVALCGLEYLNSTGASSALLDALLVGVDADKLFDTRSVTAQQVSDAAKTVLKANPTYVVYGTTTGTPSFSTISKLLA